MISLRSPVPLAALDGLSVPAKGAQVLGAGLKCSEIYGMDRSLVAVRKPVTAVGPASQDEMR